MPAHPRRKAFGQHFLKDKKLCEHLTELCLEKVKNTHVKSLLEVGPGSGALTEPLIRGLAEFPRVRFSVVEKDRKWATHWSGVVRVHDVDFMDLPQKEWLDLPPLGVISNLPYSAGTSILLRFIEHPDQIPFLLLMFQAEVAQRLRAEPRTKAWGSLSLWVQSRWNVTLVAKVPPAAFQPPPDVNSEVVLLEPLEKPRIHALSTPDSGPEAYKGAHKRAHETWNHLLRACFAHRRKMLRAGLKGWPKFLKALEKSSIDPTLRAEALSWDQWNELLDCALSGGELDPAPGPVLVKAQIKKGRT
ncbi:MAG: 16S rRNA (adenine(1518)-N(6)/adenine(1519)-N(6))-dimethyltransferase RsmA [Oligoflexia bacterium]